MAASPHFLLQKAHLKASNQTEFIVGIGLCNYKDSPILSRVKGRPASLHFPGCAPEHLFVDGISSGDLTSHSCLFIMIASNFVF